MTSIGDYRSVDEYLSLDNVVDWFRVDPSEMFEGAQASMDAWSAGLSVGGLSGPPAGGIGFPRGSQKKKNLRTGI